MADQSKPDSLSLYSAVWTLLQAVLTSISTWYDGTSDTNLPNKAKRYNTSTNKFQTYNSTAGTWSNLGFHTAIDNHIANNELHAGVPTGAILPYGGGTAPTNFLLCTGQAVSRTTYATLFGVIGTTFGAGDNSTTFNVPNLKQRFLIGKADSGTGSTLGGTGGTIDHTHTVPTHAHTVAQHTHTMKSHTHSVSSHTHPTPAHEHQIYPHGHSTTHAYATIAISVAGGAHAHPYGTRKGASTTGGSYGNRAAVASETSGSADSNTTSTSGAHTHAHGEFSGTVGAWDGVSQGENGDSFRNTFGYAGGNTGDGGGGTTGPPSDNTTSFDGPTETGGYTAAYTSLATGPANPPFLSVNYIIRI